jgi:hypothetical protein
MIFVERRTMKELAKLGIVGLFVALSTAAQAQPVAEKPKFDVGDKWAFSQVAADGKTTTWSREIVEIPTADQLRVRLGNGNIDDYDGAMNFMPEGKPERARALAKYPLKIGSEWAVSRKFPNPGTDERGSAKVVAFETITVPAGTFQCYRVEAQTSLTNKTYNETRNWIRWYCPDVKWIAKETVETKTYNPYNPAATGTVQVSSELVKFTPGK